MLIMYKVHLIDKLDWIMIIFISLHLETQYLIVLLIMLLIRIKVHVLRLHVKLLWIGADLYLLGRYIQMKQHY